jgi:hypothetical protein
MGSALLSSAAKRHLHDTGSNRHQCSGVDGALNAELQPANKSSGEGGGNPIEKVLDWLTGHNCPDHSFSVTMV